MLKYAVEYSPFDDFHRAVTVIHYGIKRSIDAQGKTPLIYDPKVSIKHQKNYARRYAPFARQSQYKYIHHHCIPLQELNATLLMLFISPQKNFRHT